MKKQQILMYKKYRIYHTSRTFHPDLEQLGKRHNYKLLNLEELDLKLDLENETDLISLFLLDEQFLHDRLENLNDYFLESSNPFHSIILFYEQKFVLNGFRPAELIQSTYPLPINDQNSGFYLNLINRSIKILENDFSSVKIRKELLQRSHQLNEIAQIGIALATERDHDKLLSLILNKAKDISLADSGSLYLVEEDPLKNGKRLRFKLSSMNLNASEFTIPIDHNSIAGHVALTGQIVNLEDAYFPPPESNFQINKSFDQETGYRTKSMVVVPMKNQKDEVIGVLQLINRKPKRNLELKGPEHIEEIVIPFDENSIELVTSLAGQAAVSIENNILYKNIHNLFEGFVTAAVTAIESRDPTTSGHSSRVATLTVGLADAVNRTPNGKYRNLQFNSDQIREIRYASLLHDFGKVGVREKVLVKAKKLYPYDLKLIEDRFNFIKRTIQYEVSQKKIRYLIEQNREATLKELKQFDQEMERQMQEIDDYLRLILESNEPTVLESGSFDKILKIANLTYKDIYGSNKNFLDPEETTVLTIRRGSLSQEERMEIESHVTHTYKFLSQIPWTSELSQVPEIAYAHHEKLDGTGYPNRLDMPQIPVQSKLMTISDIFDALTARDRPYKRAVQHTKALDILRDEVKDNHVDKDLFNIFLEARVFDLVRSN